MSTTHTNFLGIPVEGDIIHPSSARTEQRPIEDLQGPLRELLQMEGFEGLRWRQYTPYFNDGDTCVFGLGEVNVRVAGLDEDEDGDYGDGYVDPLNTYGDPHPVLGKYFRGQYNRTTREYEGGRWLVEPPLKDTLEAADKVCLLISSGAFDNALLDAFGDHAIVTVLKDKIEVEYYEHD